MYTIVHVTFDLIGAGPNNYNCVKEGLENLALADYLYCSQGRYTELPHNTFVGEYREVKDIDKFADLVLHCVESVFSECEVEGHVFILVAGKTWVWLNKQFGHSQ